jgi:flavin-binding protein dodecin
MATVKTVEIIGTSAIGWEDAARNALRTARETHTDITAVDVRSWTGTVAPNGQIVTYQATVKVAFRVRDKLGD